MISKKLVIIRIIIVLIILLFICFFIFLLSQIHFFSINNRKISTISVVKKEKIEKETIEKNYRKPKETKKPKKKEEHLEAKVIEIDRSIFPFIEAIKKRRGTYKENEYEVYKNINAVEDYEEDDYLARIQNIYDNGYYPKNSWVLIDDDFDGYGYNYYFDANGKIVYDTV